MNTYYRNTYINFIKLKFLFWIVITAIFIIWINLSKIDYIKKCDLGYYAYIPYININKEYLCSNDATIFPVFLYFAIFTLTIIISDIAEFFINKNNVSLKNGTILSFWIIIIYFYCIYSWFFLGGFKSDLQQEGAFLHKGSLVMPFVFAIAIPGLSTVMHAFYTNFENRN